MSEAAEARNEERANVRKRGGIAGEPHYIINENVRNKLDTPLYNPELRKYICNGIAQNIRVEMEKRDLSIRKLSERSGLEYTHLSNILREKNKIGLQALISVAYAMDLTPGELFPYDSNTRKSNGARFDDLTKECDLATVNTILGIVADYVKDIRRIKHSF